MTIDPRILACAVASLVGHLVLREVLEELPERPRPPVKQRVTVRVVEAPPPPPEPPPPVPEPPPPPPPTAVAASTPQKADTPRPRPAKPSAPPSPASDAPPAATPTTTTTTTTGPTQPVYGVSMESTNSNGSGPAVKTGNSSTPTPETPAVKPSGGGGGGSSTEPVAAAEVTKMPLPRGRCAGKYTDEAREAAIEGVVVLELVVGPDGKPRNVKVVSGLSHGLTEAAVAALKACTFDPGERNGVAVAVRVREFKIRFVLDSD